MTSTEIRDRRRTLRYRGLLVKQMVQMKNRISGLLMETGVSYNKQRLHKVGYFTELMSDNEEIDCVRPLLKLSRETINRSQKLDYALVSRPGNTDIQLDLFLDYANNLKVYPKFQEYFRKSKPPLLAIWGKNDPFFIPPGAEAYKRDIPNATVQFLDTGHFALETHVEEIAVAVRELLGKTAG